MLSESSDSASAQDELAGHRIVCKLDNALAARNITLTELSARTGITMANLSILKNNRARAIRFSSLTLICDALSAQPGELFEISPPPR